METRHFRKILCEQKVITFFLSTHRLNIKWVPRLNILMRETLTDDF